MGEKSIIYYFLPSNLSSDVRQIGLAHIQIKFILISILIDVCYLLVSSYIGFKAVEYVTGFSFLFLFSLLWSFKLGTPLRITSHLFVFYFWLVVITVTFFSGGIESYVLAWIALIPIMAISLLSSRAAWRWGIMGVITVFAFYFVEYEALVPSHLFIAKNNIWNASLHIGLQFFILTLAYVFGRNQNGLIRQIERQRQEILKQKENYKTNYESVKKLSEIGKEITSSLNLDTALLNVYNKVNELMDADVFGIGIYDKDRQIIEYKLAIERGRKYIPYARDMKDKNQFPVWCIENNNDIFINDLKNEYQNYVTKNEIMLDVSKLEDGSLSEEPASLIYVPLLSSGVVKGILTVQSFQKNAYSENHLNIIKNLANFISVAIENSQTFSRLAKSHENIILLNKIGQDISSNISIENIVHSVYQNISTLMSAERFGIGIVDKAKNAIIFKDYSANLEKFNSLEFPLDNTDWLAVHCVNNNVEIISGDIKAEYKHYIPSVKKTHANMLLLNSIMVLPLVINEEVIGCIGVQCKQKFAYTDYHLNLLRSISIDVSIAVENARTFEQLENKSAENKILYDLSSNLIESLELDELLDKIMDAAVKVVPNAQSGSIFLHNAESNMLEGKVSYGISNEQIKKIRLKEGEGISGKAMEEKRSFIENNYLEDTLLSPEHKQVLEQVKKPIKSIIVVLLKVKQKIIGTISLDNYDKNNAFADVDLEILTSLAANASAAIERVRMYELIEEVNADLMMAYSKLKELDEYKEGMTAMIVHDFKNSLNTVISFSEGAPTERRLKSIRQAGQFMLNMVLNILDVQKFEAAKFELALGNYPIDKVIQEAIDQLSYTMEQKSIKLTYAKNDNLYLRVDYELVTRVVVNILSNAIKYVTTNGVVKIITEKKEDDIYIAIKDNGPGIPPDKVDQVFDKYSQIDAKKSGSVRSTGIGLTFCKMVIEAHNGLIAVESIEGEGSNFYFTLPLLEQNIDAKSLIQKFSIKEDKELILTRKEYEFLTSYLKELQKWEVYDYSEVTTIVENVKSKKGNIKLWKDKMMKALQNVNEEKYKELIKLIEYAEES